MAGSFVYTPASGTILHAGADQTLSVTFDPTDSADYNSVTQTTSINVNPAILSVSWPNPSAITYGTLLGPAQLDAAANGQGTYVYTPAAGTLLGAGPNQTLSVTFTPTYPSDYLDYTGPVTETASINVSRLTPSLTWANPSNITFGTALTTTQLDASATIPGTFTYTPAVGTILNAGANQVLYVKFTPTDSTDYTTSTASALINVSQILPIVTWGAPDDITYGTALGAAQLDATTSVPGTFTYTPSAGTVLTAGQDQTLSATFTPTDSVDYASVTKTTSINVDQATPVITWTNPSQIVVGTALSANQLDATSSVPGTFSYTPALGTVLHAGQGQVLFTSFTPTDTTDYQTTTATVTINVAKVTPTVTWDSPVGITYGTPLSGTQLDATASVPGTFTYTPPVGTILNAGSDQTLSVLFTPTDTTDDNTVTATTTINVSQATPVLTWSNPADITYGTVLSGTQLDATASTAGTFTYSPQAGTLLGAGANQTLSVLFTPSDSVDYTTANTTATISVDQATPIINWSNPADITYGTPLSSTQLDATSPVEGTFSYMPGAGTVLGAGLGQELSVSFTPTDTVDYTDVTVSTSINVNKATPVINWENPDGITYGTALSSTQLDATSPVAGTFTYNPPLGTVLNAGIGQTLTATFTPTDTTDYSSNKRLGDD